MAAYFLRRFLRPREGSEGLIDQVQEIEALDDAQAILIAQAQAAEADGALLAVDLVNADERLIWRLMRGERIS